MTKTEKPPMGASQWKAHGKRYKYWEFFEKQIKEEALSGIGLLRQWINEKPKDLMVTNEMIERFLSLTQKNG